MPPPTDRPRARKKPTGRRDLREVDLPEERIEIVDPTLEGGGRADRRRGELQAGLAAPDSDPVRDQPGEVPGRRARCLDSGDRAGSAELLRRDEQSADPGGRRLCLCSGWTARESSRPPSPSRIEDYGNSRSSELRRSGPWMPRRPRPGLAQGGSRGGPLAPAGRTAGGGTALDPGCTAPAPVHGMGLATESPS